MQDLFAIAKVTRASGLNGEVRVRPLSRYFDSYVEDKPLFIGLSKNMSREVKLKEKIGIGKKVRFQFNGVESAGRSRGIDWAICLCCRRSFRSHSLDRRRFVRCRCHIQ